MSKEKTKRSKKFIIVWSLIMLWPFLGACFVFQPAIPVVLIIYLVVLLFPKSKEDVKVYGEKTRGAIEYIGTIAAEAGKTGAVITYYSGIVVKGTVEEFYKRIGGEKGAKKILDTLGKFSVEAGKICVEAGIVTGKVVVAITKYTKKRIDQEMEQIKLSKTERKLLDNDVEWKILDNEAEFTNFVNMNDD